MEPNLVKWVWSMPGLFRPWERIRSRSDGSVIFSALLTKYFGWIRVNTTCPGSSPVISATNMSQQVRQTVSTPMIGTRCHKVYVEISELFPLSFLYSLFETLDLLLRPCWWWARTQLRGEVANDDSGNTISEECEVLWVPGKMISNVVSGVGVMPHVLCLLRPRGNLRHARTRSRVLQQSKGTLRHTP